MPPATQPMSTSQAAMIARLDEEEKKKKREKAKAGSNQGGDPAGPDKAQTIGAGAASGAAAGTMVMPGIGTLIGAGIGAATSAASADSAETRASDDPNRLQRRKLGAATTAIQERKDERLRAMATLSEAVFNWAQSTKR